MGPSQSRELGRLRRKNRYQREDQAQDRGLVEPTHQEQQSQVQVQTDLRAETSQMSSFNSGSSSTPYPYSPTPPIFQRVSSSRRSSRLPESYSAQPHDTTIATNRGDNGGGGQAIDTPTLTTALTHVSHRLLRKTKEHHTFIVTGDILFSLFFRCKSFTRGVSIIQTSPLTPKQKEALISAVVKSARKYGIERDDWISNSGEVEMRRGFGMGRGEVDEVVAWSLEQKVVVFSGDGMTLYAVDFLYELKRGLCHLSRELEGAGGEVDVDDVVEVVRRLVAVEGKGRSLRREFVEGRYERLVFSDDAWEMVGREYERRFGEKGLKDGDDNYDEAEREDNASAWTDVS
ncbi:hypothetical protein TWF694_003517 [Orbilia ellipsospora]|uniref:DUF7582 domain-containing protein n=1 Tax=Orbilia ellipsospora TaxID=2528407 RepID=A0AAV9WZL2_9PEZI